MSVFDIVIGILLLYAAYKGFREGMVVQIFGILAIVIGIYLAYRYGNYVGELLRINENISKVIGFVIIMLGVIICAALLGKAVSGLFRFVGLRILDQIGGVLLSVAKTAIIVSVLIVVFEALNKQTHWASKEKLERSVLYVPLRDVSNIVFPYVNFIKDKLYE